MISAGIVTFRCDFMMLKEALASLTACTLPVEAVIVDNTPEPEYFAALQAALQARCVQSGAKQKMAT